MSNWVVALSALVLNFASPAQALPAPIEASQGLYVTEGVCENGWRGLAGDVEKLGLAIEDGVTLWVIPCAEWAVNLQSSAYLEIKDAGRADGALIKPLMFIDYDPYRGIYASPVLQNAVYDAQAKTLQTRQYYQTEHLCGSHSLYHYDAIHQAFILDTLESQDDCRNDQGPWKKILTGQVTEPVP